MVQAQISDREESLQMSHFKAHTKATLLMASQYFPYLSKDYDRKVYRKAEEQLLAFLTLRLDKHEQSAPCPSCLIPRKDPQCPLDKRLCGLHSQSEEEQNLLLLPIIKPHLLSHPAHSSQ
jgi:hypothetical protein